MAERIGKALLSNWTAIVFAITIIFGGGKLYSIVERNEINIFKNAQRIERVEKDKDDKINYLISLVMYLGQKICPDDETFKPKK